MDAKISEFIPESKIENSKMEIVSEHIGDMKKVVSDNKANSDPKDIQPTSNNCIEIPNQNNELQELDLMNDFTFNNRIETHTRKEAIKELDLMEKLIFDNHIEIPNGTDAIEELDQIDEDTSNNRIEKPNENDVIEDLTPMEKHIFSNHIETCNKKKTLTDRLNELTPNKRPIENNDFSGNSDESIKLKNEHKLINAEVCMEIIKKVNTKVKPLNVLTQDNLEQTNDKNGVMDNTDFSLRENCDDENSKNGNERSHIVNDMEIVNIDMDGNEIYLTPFSSDDTNKFNRSAKENVKIPNSNKDYSINNSGDNYDIEILQRSSDENTNNESYDEDNFEILQHSSDENSYNDCSDEDNFEILQRSSDENSNNDGSDEDFEILQRSSDDSSNNDSSEEDHSKILQPQDSNIHASSDEDDIKIAHPNNEKKITDNGDENDIKIPKLCSDIRSINDTSDKVDICIPQTCRKNVVNNISTKDIVRLKPPMRKYNVNIDKRSDARNTFPTPDKSLTVHKHVAEPQTQEVRLQNYDHRKSIANNNFPQRNMELRRYSKPKDFPSIIKNLRTTTTAPPLLDNKIEADFRRKQLEDPLTLIKLNKFKRNSRHLSTKRLIKLLKKEIKHERKYRKNKQHRKGKKRNKNLQFSLSLNKIDSCLKKGINKLFLDLNKRLSLQEKYLFHKSLRKYQSIFEAINNTMVEELKTKIYNNLLRNSYIMQRKLGINKRKRSKNSLESGLSIRKKILKEQ